MRCQHVAAEFESLLLKHQLSLQSKRYRITRIAHKGSAKKVARKNFERILSVYKKERKHKTLFTCKMMLQSRISRLLRHAKQLLSLRHCGQVVVFHSESDIEQIIVKKQL